MLRFGKVRGKGETTPKRRRQVRQEPVKKRLKKMQEIDNPGDDTRIE